jgi:hypothetical protein
MIGWGLLELGHVAWLQRDWEAARGYVAEAAAVFPDHRLLLAALESLAAVAAGQGQSEGNDAATLRAARLFGAAQGLSQSLGIPVPMWWQRFHARLLTAAREVLEGENYVKAREQGRAMSLEQAIEYATAREDETP